jgi:23S rRNA pseudouridine1911/1915/1917 synthase
MAGTVWWDGQRMSTLPIFKAASHLLVLYEDNHLLAVFKPAGMLSQGPGRGHNTILDIGRGWLRGRYSKPGNIFLGLVHRLDRPVGGVMLLARTSKAAARLSAQFRESTITKTYEAIVEGVPAPPTGVLEHRLRRAGYHRKTQKVYTPEARGREAELRYECIATGRGFCLLKVQPKTGRPHQIRAQLALIGHPIIGDKKYGSTLRISSGIGLLAREIAFVHPTRQVAMTLSAPTPPDWPWPVPHSLTSPGGPRRARHTR